MHEAIERIIAEADGGLNKTYLVSGRFADVQRSRVYG